MTYNPNIPQIIDVPSASQPQILTNFFQANTLFALNHYAFNDATVALRGKHKIVVLPEQVAGPVTTATEGAIYTKSVGGEPNLFWRRRNSGNEIQMTTNITPATSVVGTTRRGTSFLPGGLIINYGWQLVNGSVATPVAYLQPFSAVAYSIQVSIERDSGSAQQTYIVETTSTANGFSVFSTTGGAHYVYWFAIGPQ